jgi:hypothetical protein
MRSKTDNSTESDVADSYNTDTDSDTDNSTNSDVDDSYNSETDNSTESDVADSYNTDIDNSTDNDVADSNNTLNLSVDAFLNTAELDGSVSDVNVTYGTADGRRSYTEVRNQNEISGGSANFTGVGSFAQNAGNGSVTQSNVSVMSNLSTGGGGGTQ